MWLPFLGKRKAKKVVPEYRDEPMVAYVTRVKPDKFRGKSMIGDIGKFQDVTDVYALHEQIKAKGRGGTYDVKYHDQAEPRVYIGHERFSIPGDPWVDGNPIEAEEAKGGPPEVKKMRNKIEERKIEKELIKADAEVKQAREKFGLDEEEGASGGKISEVLEAVQELQARADAKEQEDAETKREGHMFDLMKTVIGGKSDSGGSEAAYKALIDSAAASNTAMMTQMQTFMNTLLSRADSEKVASGDRVNELFGATQKAFEMGIRMGQGKEIDDAPKTPTEAVAQLGDKFLDVVGNYIEQRGTKNVSVDDVKAMAKQAVGEMQQEYQPSTPQLPAPQEEEETEEGEETIGGLDPLVFQKARRGMNKVLQAFIADIKGRKPEGEQTWPTIADQELPEQIKGEMETAHEQTGTLGIINVIQKYGDPKLSKEALTLWKKVSAEAAKKKSTKKKE